MLEETNTKTQEKVTHFNQKTTKQTTAAHVEIDQPLKKNELQKQFLLKGCIFNRHLAELTQLKTENYDFGSLNIEEKKYTAHDY